MSERDWRIFREDHDIIIKGGRVPKPMRNWDESMISPMLMEAIRRAKYKAPSAI
jgi:ATP-dependent RNA helicase DDX23/PRP28